MTKNELSELENTIEYKFKDRKYLKIALTHKSYLDEHNEYLSNPLNKRKKKYKYYLRKFEDFIKLLVIYIIVQMDILLTLQLASIKNMRNMI